MTATNGNSGRWTTVSIVGIAAVLFNMFWGLAWNSITSAHDDLKRRVEWALMPKEELTERFRIIEKEQDRERQARAEAISSSVSRVELVEKWRTYEAAHQALDKKVDDLATRLSSIYSTTDVIKEMQGRIERLESELREGHSVKAATGELK